MFFHCYASKRTLLWLWNRFHQKYVSEFSPPKSFKQLYFYFLNWKNVNIYWFTSEAAITLIANNPFIKKISTDIKDFYNIDFDIVYNLEDELNFSELIQNLKYKKIIGSYLSSGKLTYTSECSEWFDMGIISSFGKRKADELKKINTRSHSKIFSDIFKVSKPVPKIYYNKIEENRIKNNALRILINPFAGNRWKSKELNINEIYKLIRMINEKF